jgi:hypothetical protein
MTITQASTAGVWGRVTIALVCAARVGGCGCQQVNGCGCGARRSVYWNTYHASRWVLGMRSQDRKTLTGAGGDHGRAVRFRAAGSRDRVTGCNHGNRSGNKI